MVYCSKGFVMGKRFIDLVARGWPAQFQTLLGGWGLYLNDCGIMNIELPSHHNASFHRWGINAFSYTKVPYTLRVYHFHLFLQGRLPRRSIQAVDRSPLSGRLEFQLTGEHWESHMLRRLPCRNYSKRLTDSLLHVVERKLYPSAGEIDGIKIPPVR